MDDNRFDRFETKLDKVVDLQAEMNATLAAQAVELKDHKRRSIANEKRIEQVNDETKKNSKFIERVKGAMAFVGFVSTIVGIAAGLYEIFS